MTNFKSTATSLFGAAIAALFAHPAFALSCIQPDLAGSYERWASSQSQYTIGRGVLKPLSALPAKRDNSVEERDNKSLEPIPYSFTGVLIGKNKSHRISTRVIVQPTCIAVWCGGYPQGNDEGIYAFEISRGNYLFRPSPRGGDAFYGDTTAQEQFIQACIKNGKCDR